MRAAKRVGLFIAVVLAVTAGLAWAGWPRPVATVTVPDVGELQGSDSFQFRFTAHGPRFLAIQGPTRGYRIWVVDRATGVVRGPWDSPASHPAVGLDPAGRLQFTRDVPGTGTAAVDALDPVTGAVTPVFRRDGPDVLGMLTGGGWGTAAVGTAAVVTGGPGRPLRFEFIDTVTGLPRRVLEFPDRPGGMYDGVRECAGEGAALSPDGRTLVVAAGWTGSTVRGHPGLEWFDTRTGELVRRTPPGPADVAPDQAAMGPWFTPDGRVLLWSVSRRTQVELGKWSRGPAPGETRHGLDLATLAPLPPGHPRLTSPWVNDPYADIHSADGSHAFMLAGITLLPSEQRGRVTDAEGKPVSDWRLLPAIRPVGFVPGTTGLLYASSDDPPPRAGRSTWGELLDSLFGPRVPNSTHTVHFHDWATDEVRVVRRFESTAHHGSQIRAVVLPRAFAVCYYDHATRTGTVEVWPAPPAREPWRWAVPTGLAAGTLAAWRAGRRKSADPPPAGA